MKLPATALLVALVASPAIASDYEPKLREYLEANVKAWMENPTLIEAIRAQNETSAEYSLSMIEELDQAWRAEIGSSTTPTITPIMENAASDILRDIVTAQGGVVTEIFVMDQHGLNVAASNVTSDYWQGDEAKFQKTYEMGVGAVHISEVEFDESSQSYQAQLSVTLVDPGTQTALGAMTVGVNADALF